MRDDTRLQESDMTISICIRYPSAYLEESPEQFKAEATLTRRLRQQDYHRLKFTSLPKVYSIIYINLPIPSHERAYAQNDDARDIHCYTDGGTLTAYSSLTQMIASIEVTAFLAANITRRD